MHQSALVICLVCVVPASAAAADNEAVLAFARENAGKFAVEIPPGPLQIGSRATIETRMDALSMINFMGQYDPSTETMRWRQYQFFPGAFINAPCQDMGSFEGQNSYGAKVTVARQRCDYAIIEDADYSSVKLLGEVKIAPATYRAAMQAGVDVRIVLSLGSGAKVPFEAKDYVSKATLQRPTQIEGVTTTVRGRIEQVSWKLPGSPDYTPIFSR